MVEVVAALIWDKDKFLICQRPANKARAYPDITVHLTLFNATIAEGVPEKIEHNDIKWIAPAEIPNYDFCPADEEILKKIKEKAGNGYS